MQAQYAGGDASSWAAAVADKIMEQVEKQAFASSRANQLDNCSVAVAALEWSSSPGADTPIGIWEAPLRKEEVCP